MWLPEYGIGWYPVQAQPYDELYWNRYRAMDDTAMGRALTTARIDLVRRHWNNGSGVVDIGVGGGRFVRDYPGRATGFDVNPTAVKWLRSMGRWEDPYSHDIDVACFWDSLEHIADPTDLLARIKQKVFVSIPIFQSATHVVTSKHYRKDEHYWYFTLTGFIYFMGLCGFECVEYSDQETCLGREGIGSFAFTRVAAPQLSPQMGLDFKELK